MFDQARAELVDRCVAMADRGFLAGTGGNLALRVDPEHFLVTPSATDYYAMGPDDICVMRTANAEQVEGGKMASVESGLHARVLQARPDCAASLHTHQPIASAYTLLDRPLRPAAGDARKRLGDPVPCVAYAPSGTEDLASLVAGAFDAATHACLMRSHGVVCVGADMEEAAARVAALEAACAGWFMARLENEARVPDATGRLLRKTFSAGARHARDHETRRPHGGLPHKDPARPHGGLQQVPGARSIKAQIEALLLKDAARFRAEGLFGNSDDSFSIRIPGLPEFFLLRGDENEPVPVAMDDEEGTAALHARLYRARPDTGALLIGRTPWCAALAGLDATIPVLFDEQARHIGPVEGSVAADDLTGLERAVAGGANIALIGSQRLCLGVTPERIVLNAELFEKCAKAFVIAHSSGEAVIGLPGDSADFYIQRLRNDQARAAETLAAGRIPEGMNAY